MSITINRNNPSRAVDRTDILVDTPYNVDITEALGIFSETYSTQKNIEIVRSTYNNHILQDRNWDERSQNIVDGARSYLNLRIPHFPAADAIYPHDVDGVFSDSDTSDGILTLESVANVRAEKMVILREAHALTLSAARFQLLRDGTVYAPHGTMRTSYGTTVNYYNEFGVTRQSIPVNFAGTADPREDARIIVQAIRQDARGASGSIQRFVALCGSEFFTALIMNPFVTDAVKYIALPGNQSSGTLLGVNADEPRFAGLDARFPSITLWGITWVDVGAAGYDLNGSFVPFVPDDEAIALPVGLNNLAKTYYAPANRFSTVNKRSQGSYWFEKASDEKVEINSEQNFLNALLYPAAVKTLTLA